MRKTSDIIWQDVQHQVLFEILDLIREPGADVEVLRRLQQYTEHHFAMEERYMELLDYPDREAHRRAHDRFRREISSLLQPGVKIDDQLGELVSTYLSEWLKLHVFGVDKQLEDFIMESPSK